MIVLSKRSLFKPVCVSVKPGSQALSKGERGEFVRHASGQTTLPGFLVQQHMGFSSPSAGHGATEDGWGNEGSECAAISWKTVFCGKIWRKRLAEFLNPILNFGRKPFTAFTPIDSTRCPTSSSYHAPFPILVGKSGTKFPCVGWEKTLGFPVDFRGNPLIFPASSILSGIAEEIWRK